MDHPLRTYRQDRKLSLDALAKLVGTSKATLWRVERGVDRPSVDLIQRLIVATGGAVDANALVAAAPVRTNGGGA